MRDVEADHRDREPALEDDTRGLRVNVDVELRRGRRVAEPDAPAHQDDPLHVFLEARILFEERRDVGERTRGEQGDRLRGRLTTSAMSRSAPRPSTSKVGSS